MTGASIGIRLQDEGFADGLARLAALGASSGPLMHAIGVGLVEAVHKRFERAQDPDGHPWKPLSPAYAEGKRGAGILRGAAMQGGLMGSITFAAGPGSVRVGSNKVYAAIHQFGGAIVPKGSRPLRFHLGKRVVFARKVTIPARPYLGFGPAERLVVTEALETELRQAMGQE